MSDAKALKSWLDNKDDREPPVCLSSLRGRNDGRRVIVIINPTSGSRSGMDVLRQMVLPILQYGGIDNITVMETSSRFSVPKQITEINLDGLDDILVVGGDGTLCGVFLGLGEHEREDALTFPVGLVPCGSHNHMFKVMSGFPSVHSKVRELDVLEALLRFVKGDTTKVSVPLVQANNNKKPTPFLCGLSFALLAAAFKTSEGLRWTGFRKRRYYAAILYQISRMKDYRYVVRYLPVTSSEEPPREQPKTFSDEWVTETGPYKWFGFSPNSFGVPRQDAINENWGYLMIIENTRSPLTIIQTILKPSLKDWENKKYARLEKVKALMIQPLGSDKDWNMDGEKMPDFEKLYVTFARKKATFIG